MFHNSMFHNSHPAFCWSVSLTPNSAWENTLSRARSYLVDVRKTCFFVSTMELCGNWGSKLSWRSRGLIIEFVYYRSTVWYTRLFGMYDNRATPPLWACVNPQDSEPLKAENRYKERITDDTKIPNEGQFL